MVVRICGGFSLVRGRDGVQRIGRNGDEGEFRLLTACCFITAY